MTASALDLDLSILSLSQPEDHTSEPNDLLAALDITGILVDTIPKLKAMLKSLHKATQINVDFEGIDLCKTGKVCLGQFHASASSTVYIVDFIALKGDIAFTTGEPKSLKGIMESPTIRKVIFDPRNDVDAIANQFNVHPRNVVCLQVAEVAYRKVKRGLAVRYVLGLKKVLEEHVRLPYSTKLKVMKIKEAGVVLFAPEKGGSYEVFAERPLSPVIEAYAAIDVFYFDQLMDALFHPLPSATKAHVMRISDARLIEYKERGYDPKGRSKSIAPSIPRY